MLSVKLSLFGKENKVERKEINFDIEQKQECPDFNNALSGWEIDMNKEIADTYSYTFPEMSDKIKIKSVAITVKGMNYD